MRPGRWYAALAGRGISGRLVIHPRRRGRREKFAAIRFGSRSGAVNAIDRKGDVIRQGYGAYIIRISDIGMAARRRVLPGHSTFLTRLGGNINEVKQQDRQ